MQKVCREKHYITNNRWNMLELCHRNWRFVHRCSLFWHKMVAGVQQPFVFFCFLGRFLIFFCLKEIFPLSAFAVKKVLRRTGSSPHRLGLVGLSSIDPLRNFGVHHNHRSPLREKIGPLKHDKYQVPRWYAVFFGTKILASYMGITISH